MNLFAVINTRPSHPSEPSRILQVVPIAGTPGLDPKARLDKKDNENDPHGEQILDYFDTFAHKATAPLQLTLHGGRYMKQSQKASFQFLCDHQAEDVCSQLLLVRVVRLIDHSS